MPGRKPGPVHKPREWVSLTHITIDMQRPRKKNTIWHKLVLKYYTKKMATAAGSHLLFVIE